MIVVAVAVVLVVVVGVWMLVTYNRFVARRLACENSYSQIDVALKRRHDLVPSLTSAVAGYATHERGALEEVTQARAGAIAADDAPAGQRGQAEARLADRIGTLAVIVEQYPDLKASASFRDLQDRLVEVENQIQITRRVYNDTVETYNTLVQQFPALLIAGPFGFRQREFFTADLAARAAPGAAFDAGPDGNQG